MIIGTMHKEEARVFDSDAGYHQFQNEDGSGYGSFEVFWNDGNEYESAGWYWQACFEGCLPDGEMIGPFGTSNDAYHDAQEGAQLIS